MCPSTCENTIYDCIALGGTSRDKPEHNFMMALSTNSSQSSDTSLAALVSSSEPQLLLSPYVTRETH